MYNFDFTPMCDSYDLQTGFPHSPSLSPQQCYAVGVINAAFEKDTFTVVEKRPLSETLTVPAYYLRDQITHRDQQPSLPLSPPFLSLFLLILSILFFFLSFPLPLLSPAFLCSFSLPFLPFSLFFLPHFFSFSTFSPFVPLSFPFHPLFSSFFLLSPPFLPSLSLSPFSLQFAIRRTSC